MFVNTVNVETYLGIGSNAAPKYGDSSTVKCWLQDGNQLVRDGEGAEVVSTTTVYGPLTSADLFVVGSKVTANGRTSRVLTLGRFDGAGLVSAASHFRANLT